MQIDAGDNYYHFGNIRKFKALLRSLEPVPQFQPMIEALEESELYSTAQNELRVPKPAAIQIAKLANSLYAGAVSLLEMLRVALPEERQESITIKLPENDNLREVGETLLTLQKAIAQVVVNETIQGDVRVETWEPGSLWLIIWLKTLSAVNIIGRVTRAAALLAQEVAKWKVVTAQVETLKLKNDAMKQLVDAQDKLLKNLVDRESRAIEDSFFPAHDNERQERLKESIRTISELIFKGAEIHPSLRAPAESKEVFPKYDELPTSVIKQLQDKPGETLPEPEEPDEPDEASEPGGA